MEQAEVVTETIFETATRPILFAVCRLLEFPSSHRPKRIALVIVHKRCTNPICITDLEMYTVKESDYEPTDLSRT